MRTPRFDARRLDVQAFAMDGATLAGSWPAADLTRLMDHMHCDCSPSELAVVPWQVVGDHRRPRTTDAQIWLHLKLQAHLPLVCQRCLGAVHTCMDIDTSIRFVRGEDAAAQLDAQGDADVLALTKSLDLQVLVEDELLLALPLVPRHERCAPGDPQFSKPPTQAPRGEVAEHPFAALALLKRGSSSRP